MEKVYPSDLTDKQWNLIKPHIPDAKEGGRPRTIPIPPQGTDCKI